MRIDADKLLSETDIVQTVGRYVPLKKRGAEHEGVCPFHDDQKASLKVNQSKQMYKCFACGAGGDSIDFLMRLGRTFHEACEEINGGIMPEGGTNPEKRTAAPPRPNSWLHVTSPPAEVTNITHYKHGVPSKVWAYRDGDGDVIGYVCRFDLPDGGKEILPYVYATDGNRSEWRWMGFAKPRPLYNFDLIKANPKATILIVEGEKTADAAQAQLDPAKTVVTTWIGGARAIAHTNWNPVQGRKVILWPDNDNPGREAMQEINSQVDSPLRKWVNVPAEFPDKWDAADKEWQQGELRQFILDNISDVPTVEPEPEPEPKPKKPKPEGPKNPPPPPPAVVTEPKPFALWSNNHFRMLGYDKDENSRLVYYFFSFDAKAVIRLAPSAMSKANLLMLAPLNYWEMEFPSSGKAKVDIDAAMQYLMFTSHQIGPFKDKYIRGRGAWVDDDRFIIHTGDALLLDGQIVPLKEFRSKYVYEIGERLGFGTSQPLTAAQARQFLDKCRWLLWEREINAYLLAGWCVIAPFCGILQWRPHIWVTGPAGSGKSWVMDNIVKKALGETAIVVQGKTTEAGVRGLLQNDARPVLFDESDVDSHNDKERIQSILALARSSSYHDGGVIGKGTVTGSSRTYTMRSCFAFSSIGVQLNQQSDRSRFTMLGLVSFENIRPEAEFKAFDRDWHKLVTDEYVKALQSRTIGLLPVILKNARTFAEAVAHVIGNRRIGDQVGAMLAGAYSLSSNKEINLDDAIKWVEDRDWTEERGLELTKDEYQLFGKLMGHITRVETDGAPVERTIGELVQVASGYKFEPTISRNMAQDRLRRIGFLVKDNDLYVANSADGVFKIIKDTSWSNNFNRILERLPGASKVEPRTYYPGLKSRGVSIPLELINRDQEATIYSPFGAVPEDDPF
jgi:putative DNA primase/helicase